MELGIERRAVAAGLAALGDDAVAAIILRRALTW